MSIKKHKSENGFTLVEVIVTVAILSFGLVTIFEALFVSVDHYGYYTHYLSTQDWINEKIWESQETLLETAFLEEEETAGQFIRGHKKFNWTQSVHLIDPDQGLYKVRVALSWNEGEQRPTIKREAYLLPFTLKNYEEGSV